LTIICPPDCRAEWAQIDGGPQIKNESGVFYKKKHFSWLRTKIFTGGATKIFTEIFVPQVFSTWYLKVTHNNFEKHYSGTDTSTGICS